MFAKAPALYLLLFDRGRLTVLRMPIPSSQLSAPGLRQMRLESGWSLRELADRCAAAGQHLTYSALGKIERGVHPPRVSTLYTLAKVWGLSVAKFVAATHAAAYNASPTDSRPDDVD